MYYLLILIKNHIVIILLDENGNVKNPVKCTWEDGSVFVTPPGWWHSHHNDGEIDAYVLPIQDAGLYTYQRTLNIEFS